MSKDYDTFDDVLVSNRGIYGSDTAALGNALGEHEQREVRPTPDGLLVKFTHDWCGQSQRALIDWADVLPVSFGLAPKTAYAMRIDPTQPSLAERYPQWVQNLGDWQYDAASQTWFLTKLNCRGSSCTRREMSLALTPSEALESIRVARSQRWVKDEPTLVNWIQKAVAIVRARQPQAR